MFHFYIPLKLSENQRFSGVFREHSNGTVAWTELNVLSRQFSTHLILSETFKTFGIYLFKIMNKNTRTMWGICSKLAIKTTERRQWRRWLYCHVLLSLLLTLDRFHALFWYFYSWLWTSKCQLSSVLYLI